MDINELLDFIAGHPNIHTTPEYHPPLEETNNPPTTPGTPLDNEDFTAFMNNQTFNPNF